MGFYINPNDKTKEDWLEDHGIVVENPTWELSRPFGRVLVCLVDNGPFTAAAVAYKEAEFDEFVDPTDGRQRTWYSVPRSCIIDVCPEVELLLA